ncbi:MAG: FkbM family methyltransferase [Planctomycetota bacterium]|jgi:FkbM family methyltransferase
MPRLPLLKHPILHCTNKWLHHKCKYATTPEGTVIEENNGVKFLYDFTLGKMVKSMFFGCYDFEIRRLLKKYLRPGGVFIDVGANIGYLSAIAAGFVGRDGQVHSFEPVPIYFRYALKTAKLNPDYNMTVNNVALGETNGVASIANHMRNIGGSSLVPGFILPEDTKEIFTVEVRRLDEYIQKMKLSNISLIKIDTEGFELPVLLGASRFFDENRNCLPPVIVEVTPEAFERMDREVYELVEFMSDFGYRTYSICGRHRIDIRKATDQINVLFKT